MIRDTYKEIVGIDTIEGTNFAAIFGHLVPIIIIELTVLMTLETGGV